MTDSNNSQRQSSISEDTKIAVSEILRNSANLRPTAIARVIRKIESGAIIAGSMDLPDSPGATRDELHRLGRAIDRLVETIIGISKHGNFAMWDAARGQKSDERLANFDGDGKFGSELYNLRNSAELIQKAAQLAVEGMVIPRGSPPNVPARHFAFHVAVALEENGVEPNTTTNGPYFSVLDELFSELLPTEDGAAFQRYGRWALSDPTLEETFLNTDYQR